MSETNDFKLKIIAALIVGLITGISSVAVTSISTKASKLADAVLIQNIEIRDLKIEIAVLKDREKRRNE